ncbi:HlyD family efflux transporter periplasmic adaptor subunit [Accumulibacter sp.]|jgi:biotin carboxyl carrier protein|uniref:HlyD family efflux transporter periplasmic adaptor subunit n=3 Tax=Accumulibacter sp. TaxID=2053492 RepID=UPI001AC8ED2B|nr:HlyD family efflux transporter periplasmic adaptor subunit [Accumulibacter sp.]MBN8516011.1 HlyD family efflux transporter periplasmic adaptor subunit [Accumulibacter sp.]MBO3702358.1 HlyD family efflux transporter periplasmic adaptor subunit [Accumulibacter sp.]
MSEFARPSDAAQRRLLQLQTPLLAPQPLEQAASTLCSELACTLAFDRVSVGLSTRAGLTLVAASPTAGSGDGEERSQALTLAMQEAIDQNASIVYPLPSEAAPRVVQAHARLAAQGSGTLLSVPLIGAGQTIGCLCFERQRAVTADELRVIEPLVCMLTPLLALKQRAELGWSARASEALRGYWGGSGRRTRRLAWLGGLVAIVALAMFPVSHRIGAPARLEGATQRVLAAPSDGYLRAAHVRPGDVVAVGQVLVELAQQDLLLQNRKWEAELTQHQNSAAAALARADRSQYAIAQARAAEAGAQLELAQAQLVRSQVTAPIDGLVIQGDLSQALGAPVQRGDVLLTLAPRDAFRLIIEVDERSIGGVVLGQRGQLALSALPGERLDFAVTRISPMALTLEGRNAFEIEAAFGQPPAGLRPGLRGVAKIDAGTRSLAWVATHRIGDWLRMATWTWGL